MALLDVLTRPPQLPRAAERPRLRALLSAGVEPACLLVAPAGSGKTVAAAQWLHRVATDVADPAGRGGVRAGWCRFAPGAAGGDDLVRLVSAALGHDVVDAGATPLERAAAVLDVLGDGPVALVVDDYDLARPEECDVVLAEVLALAPPGCRIVVCSATRPAGLLGRASVGHVRVVGADELAFTEDEVAALLESLGRDVALATDLHATSAGWATAVAVLAESVNSGSTGAGPTSGGESVGPAESGSAGVGPTSGGESVGSAGSGSVGADPATAGGLAGSDGARSATGFESEVAAESFGSSGAGPSVGVDPAGSARAGSGSDLAVGSAGPGGVGGVGLTAAAVDVVLDRAGLGRDEHGGRGDDDGDLLAIMSLAPAVGPAELGRLGLDPRRLAELASTSALLRPVGDRWALLDLVRDPLQRRLGLERLRLAADRLAPVLATTDPVAAADLLMVVGDHAGAADLLARHASAVPPDAALPLLYRMPADVRRRLPPLLSGARATVEMDSALASAEQRLASARDDHERQEAQVAIGTILLHRGQLASAAATLESVVRATDPGAGTVAATARGWLALARFWAGDLEGAAALAALSNDPDPVDDSQDVGPTALVWWVAGEIGLARDDTDLVERAVGRLRRVGWHTAADAVIAQQALAGNDDETAAAAAAAAYRAAVERGGLALVVAAPPHAWCLARSGRWDEAAAVADELRRRLGNVDTCARLHADLVAQARAVHAGDLMAETKATRAIAATRRLGYAPVESAARRWLPPPPASRPGFPARPSASSSGDHPPGSVVGPPGRLASDDPPGSGAVTGRSADPGAGGLADGGPGAADPGIGGWPAASDGAGWERPRSGLEVGVLGPVTVHVDGRAVVDGAWRSRKAREVLLVLALAGHGGRSRDEVIEAVWPERDPVKGRTLLRTALTEVRQVLEPQRPPGEPSRFVTTRGDRVTVEAHTDMAQAEHLYATARRTAAGVGAAGPGGDGPGADVAALAAAWALFRGPFAADEAYAASLDEARRTAERLQLDVADALVAAGSAGPSVDHLEGRPPVAPELLVAAAAHVVAAEPWRTDDVVGRVTEACRAAGDEVQARRAERLLRP